MSAPKLQKGALIGFDPVSPLSSIVVFQYNPAELRRTLRPRIETGRSSPTDTLRLGGAAHETITASLHINAIDQLEVGNTMAETVGIAPQLAALEMLLYPKVATVLANTALAALGTLEIVPPSAPLILFVWGAKRVSPVLVEQLDVHEEYYDANLNPIVAEVTVQMRVLTYDDFTPTSPGWGAYMSHQTVQEALAALESINNASSLMGS